MDRDAAEELEAQKIALRRTAAALRPTLVVGALSGAGPPGAPRFLLDPLRFHFRLRCM